MAAAIGTARDFDCGELHDVVPCFYNLPSADVSFKTPYYSLGSGHPENSSPAWTSSIQRALKRRAKVSVRD